jgi:hypothetical protein
MAAFHLDSTDIPAVIRFLERDALALIASMPAEALRLAYLAAELRLAVAR